MADDGGCAEFWTAYHDAVAGAQYMPPPERPPIMGLRMARLSDDGTVDGPSVELPGTFEMELTMEPCHPIDLGQHVDPGLWLTMTGRWPWQWPDRAGWPQRRQLDALVAPRLTEAQRRAMQAWLYACDALRCVHDAARALAGRTVDYRR